MDQFDFEDDAIKYIKPIIDLANKRKNYILAYQQDIDIVVPDADTLLLSDALTYVQEFLSDNTTDYSKSFYYIDPLSFQAYSREDKFTLNQYLEIFGGYSKNRLADWTTGKHYTQPFLRWKRETALRTFLYLGIPVKHVDAFFKYYGMQFGSGTDAFVIEEKNNSIALLPESYIRNLMHIGISYDIINYLVPKKNS